MPVPVVFARPFTFFSCLSKKRPDTQKQCSKKKQNKRTRVPNKRTTASKKEQKSRNTNTGRDPNESTNSTHAAYSARTREQATRGPGHRTRTRIESGKGTGRNQPHPKGPKHWGDPADPTTSGRSGTSRPLVRARPSCIRYHGKRHPEPWQQPVTDMPAHSKGGDGLPSSGEPHPRTAGVRRWYRRLAGAITPVVRDTPHGSAAPRAAAHRRGHVALTTGRCGATRPARSPGLVGRDTAFQRA